MKFIYFVKICLLKKYCNFFIAFQIETQIGFNTNLLFLGLMTSGFTFVLFRPKHIML